ncbi:MAG: AAA family ATPase [Myxococcales bacterium]|nr:AAA family ATPase [Myxococcales bacterium]
MSARRVGAAILLLVGPKGSGKTTLGRALGELPGATFLDVEAVARRELAARGGVLDQVYVDGVLDATVAEARAQLVTTRRLALETTGAFDGAARYLARLRALAPVILIRVRAGLETCARRIAARDASRQVAIPDDMIRAMHRRCEALTWPWDLVIDNDPPQTPAAVVARVSAYLEGRA